MSPKHDSKHRPTIYDTRQRAQQHWQTRPSTPSPVQRCCLLPAIRKPGEKQESADRTVKNNLILIEVFDYVDARPSSTPPSPVKSRSTSSKRSLPSSIPGWCLCNLASSAPRDIRCLLRPALLLIA